MCEDEKNDDFISATIENGKTSMIILIQIHNIKILEVKQIKSTEKTTVDLKVKILRQNKTEHMELSLFEEVTLGKYICLIRD